MPPSFFYFDLGNVLLNFDHHRAARQMAAVAGIGAEQVWEVVFGSDLEQQYEAGAIDSQAFYAQFCERTGTRPDYDALMQAGNEIFEINSTILPVVAHLEAAGRPLGILSNTNPSHWAYCTSGLYGIIPRAFRTVVLSYEVRALKPDARIYAVAAERAGVDPGEIFYVDDRQENVEGAQRAGYDAVLYTTSADLARQLYDRKVRCNL